MHILLVHQYFLGKDEAGGSRWNQFAKYWSQKGHKVTVIAGMYSFSLGGNAPAYKGKMFVREITSDGVEVIRVRTTDKYDKNYFWRACAYFNFMFFGLIGALLYASQRFDMVLASSPPLTVGLLGIVLSIFKRCPFIFEVRDLWPESAIDTGVVSNGFLIKIMYWMEHVSYKKAIAINVLTPAFRKALIERKKIEPEKVWFIPNAADMEIIKPGPMQNEIRKKYNWNDKFVGLYIGAYGKANYLWQLIETAKVLRDEPEYLIACVGNGMEKEALIKKSQDEGLTNIQFLPAVAKEEVSLYLNACNISLIVLKKVETFKTVYPNKMFDSMAAAKPIIIAIDGAARELVVEQAMCGKYVEPENAKEIAAAMRFYRASPEIVRQQGQTGYEFVKRNYDRSNLAAEYLELIKDKVGGKGRK